MSQVQLDGISTYYEVIGTGPPLLLFAPGGFDATIDKWSTAGVWKSVRPLETLSAHFTCIAYDRRESGRSGGRVQRLTWRVYAEQAKALVDHLGYESVFVLGACMGCSAAAAFGTAFPRYARAQVLHWPVGGTEWCRIARTQWFDVHAAFVETAGLRVVADLAVKTRSFMKDFRAGPWASVLSHDAAFAAHFISQATAPYLSIVSESASSLFSTEASLGATEEAIRATAVRTLLIPGNDIYHSPQAARRFREALPEVRVWEASNDSGDSRGFREELLSFLMGATSDTKEPK